MATAVESSNSIAHDIKEPDTSKDEIAQDDGKKDEVTNGEDHKEEDTNGASEQKPKDKFADFRDHDSRKNDGRNKYGDRKWDRKRDDHGGRGRGRDNNRGRGRYQNNKFQNRSKANYDHLEESNDAGEIRRQVEFYFSDSNLPVDAYLLKLTGGHENNPVDLKVIHSFKRMKHFQPYSAVRDAVAESAYLNLNDKDEITRKKPLDAKYTDDAMHNRTLVHGDSMSRSIYAKGFGNEVEASQQLIEEFFAPFGEIRSVRLRRHNDGLFKGSVFVEFADDQTAKDFLELDPKPKYGDNERELQIMTKQEYVDTKHQGILDGSVKPRSPVRDGGKWSRGRGDRGRDRGRGGFRRGDGKRDGRSNRNGDRRGRRDSGGSDEGRLTRDRDEDYSEDERNTKRRRSASGERSTDGDKRSASADDKKRKREDKEDEVPTRAEAEAKRAKVESEATAGAGAEKAGGEEVKEAVEA
jgi:lupus La protein